MKKTVRMKKTVFRYVSFALIVSALLLSPQVARADIIFGAQSGGNTEAHSCSADVWFIVVPVSLDIDEGDKIQIWFNYFWYDNRSANSPPAVHYFKVNYTWETDSDYEDTDLPATTGGNAAGSSALVLETDPVDEYGTLGITWFASITVTTPYCFDSDTKVHGIGLV
jgi:hypothetical protein